MGANSNIIIVKHNHLAPKTAVCDTPLSDILVEVDTFPSHAKVQPFTVSASSSALLLVDVHCHLSKTPVCGELTKQPNKSLRCISGFLVNIYMIHYNLKNCHNHELC